MILALIVAFIAYIIAQVIVNSTKNNNNGLVPPSGNILIFDTETNSFPKDWKTLLHDTYNCPRLVSISWNKIAPDGKLLSNKNYLIKPDGFSIDIASINVHGITNEFAQKNGQPLKEIVLEFNDEIGDCKYIVAHNIEFDYAVIFNEYMRLNLDAGNLCTLKQICTMKKSTDFCKIQSSKGYKYPKLNELHQKLFQKSISTEHNAQTDAEACMRCFKELYNKKVIKF